MKVGDKVTISGVDYVHPVTLLSKPTPMTASLVGVDQIDFYNRDDDKITLRSNDSNYNGTFELKSTDVNRKNFQIRVKTATPATTAEVINVVESNLSFFNGQFTVTDVVTDDQFKVACDSADTTLLEGGKFYCETRNININATVDIEHIIQNIQQSTDCKSYLYCSASPTSISRDRAIKTDSPQRLEQGMDIQIDAWSEFSVFAIISTGNAVDPVETQDYCNNELKITLLKSLLGYKPESTFTAEYDYIYYSGDNNLIYNEAYYIHQYNFGCTIKINSDDAFKPQSCLVNTITTDYLTDESVKATDTVTFTN